MVTVFEKARDHEEWFEGLRRNEIVTVACPSVLNMCRVVTLLLYSQYIKNHFPFDTGIDLRRFFCVNRYRGGNFGGNLRGCHDWLTVYEPGPVRIIAWCVELYASCRHLLTAISAHALSIQSLELNRLFHIMCCTSDGFMKMWQDSISNLAESEDAGTKLDYLVNLVLTQNEGSLGNFSVHKSRCIGTGDSILKWAQSYDQYQRSNNAFAVTPIAPRFVSIFQIFQLLRQPADSLVATLVATFFFAGLFVTV